MNTYQFKTNINCTNCEARVKPFLDEAEGIKKWTVDFDNPDKILTVETEGSAEAVIEKVEEVGFQIEGL